MSDNHAEEFNRQQVDASERANKIYEQTIALLKTEDRFVNFFNSYNQQSVEGFIPYYAQKKTIWHSIADSLYKHRLHKQSKWRNAALNMLKEIFFKKLFNLKCRWVAGEMDLPGINISNDFKQWSTDPSSCNIVEPITPEEFNCYLDFLSTEAQRQNDNEEEDERASAWSSFEFYHGSRSLFVDGYEKMIPRWFHHYDTRFGTAHLQRLSTIRTDIEQDYNDIWEEEIYRKTLSPEQLSGWTPLSRLQRKELFENPEKEKAYREEQNRQYEEREKNMPHYISLSIYNRKIMNELVGLIETPEVKNFYHAQVKWRRRNSSAEQIESILIDMKEAKEYIPVESDDDYRNAIENAYEKYARKIEMETLPVLFDEYFHCLSSGKPFDWKSNSPYDSLSAPHINDSGSRILAARKWKGEPENFDFLKKENLPIS
ncbi:MAG: hypothetical protein AABZ32_08510 [Bacteroidota bacterium]